MRMCLAGKAVEYFIKLEDQGKCDTYHDFIRRMELRFSHKDDPVTVRMQFSNLRQMLDESLEDWGERVMTQHTKHSPVWMQHLSNTRWLTASVLDYTTKMQRSLS